MFTRGIANMFRIAELRKRLLFTFGLLAVYRLGIFVTTPGVDRGAMKSYLQSSGGLLSLFNLFSGGALEQLSIFALGIMPYISSSIILQLLTVVIPALEKLQKEGELGRRKITQYTRYGTIVLSVIQGFSIALYLESIGTASQAAQGIAAGVKVVQTPGWGFRLLTVITLTAGTAFIMWLGEQITERGIGNGISLIIFAGIVARLPDAVVQTFLQFRSGNQELSETKLLVLGVLMVTVIAIIVFFERGQRRIPVQYAKRVVGRKVYGGQSTHLPLKVNSSGVIPPIFASSILMFPATLGAWIPPLQKVADVIQGGGWVYNSLYVGLIVFFAYFYTAVTFNPVDVADNMKKHGGYIPGIRPGKKTAEYIDKVLTRITFGGAVYLAAICVLPTVVMAYFSVPFYFGGTSLLIVVGVALDTVQQIEGHLITRNYEGFTGPRGPRIRGRTRIAAA
ncbi:MAG TPA: preprotein translocase subunit SecY [Myxococcales bacterium]|nr:preprotein translocase subunit SecY [Myxococcales bacterium]